MTRSADPGPKLRFYLVRLHLEMPPLAYQGALRPRRCKQQVMKVDNHRICVKDKSDKTKKSICLFGAQLGVSPKKVAGPYFTPKNGATIVNRKTILVVEFGSFWNPVGHGSKFIEFSGHVLPSRGLP